MRLSTEGLARSCSRHPWRTIGVWVVVLVLSFGTVATLLGGVLTGEGDVTSETESKRANELLFERFPHDQAAMDEEISEVVVIRTDEGRVESDAVRGRVRAFARALRRAGATNVVTVEEDADLVSSDGDATAVLVGLGGA
ncbi:MAG: hypothetical protein M3304_05355, partial [Actinomycetota bacterium]|nr:hypothetical protein [Actinomycetota bacterium]